MIKGAWKLLVGIKDALVLLFMLFFFGMIYAGLSARPAPVPAACCPNPDCSSSSAQAS